MRAKWKIGNHSVCGDGPKRDCKPADYLRDALTDRRRLGCPKQKDVEGPHKDGAKRQPLEC